MHAVAPLLKEKLEPAVQFMHTLSEVVVQGACWYVPAGHAEEQGKHCVAPLVREKLEPAIQGVHTLSDVLVQAIW